MGIIEKIRFGTGWNQSVQLNESIAAIVNHLRHQETTTWSMIELTEVKFSDDY
jgi:hypothetical protein